MFKNILTKEQIKLLPLIKLFSKKFYLVGGTAIALQISHRRLIILICLPKNFLIQLK